MRSTRVSLGVAFGFVALTATEALAQPNLLLRVKTKLGVDAEVAVGLTRADNVLLGKLGAAAYRAGSDECLAVRVSANVVMLVKWKAVKEATREGAQHTVTLADGSRLVGTVQGTVETEAEPRRTYDLATATAFSVVSSKPGYRLSRAKTPGAWTLTVPGSSQPYAGSAPRFVFQYYSSSGYVMGGSEREVESTTFQVMVDNEAVTGELADFQSLSLTASTASPARPTLTLQAPGGTPVSGAISLSIKDDKGDHPAHAGWMLALDLDEVRTIAVTQGGWKLERK
jgi:hypothetical protein